MAASGFSFVVGAAMWLGLRRTSDELQPRDGLLLVALAWSVVPAFAALPLWIYFDGTGTSISFTDAYFEAVSGLTTTGATVLVGLDKLPISINLWRCFLQWVGRHGNPGL